MINVNTRAWTPSVTVAAVIERDNQFLMVEEPVEGGTVFNQPAGHLEDNECLIEAVIREVREETAWKFTPEFIVGIYQWKHPQTENTYVRITFSGSVTDHHPEQPLFDGIVGTVWKTQQELQQNKQPLRSPMVLQCISDYLTGNRFPLALLKQINVP